VAFDAKVWGKIGFETLQSRKNPGIPHVPIQKGCGLRQNGPKRFGGASSLRSTKGPRSDNNYSSDYICFPLVKGSHKEGSSNHKIDFPHTKYLEVFEGLSWKKCSKGPTWQMTDTLMGHNKWDNLSSEHWLLGEHN
jgi:hypothetical protein